jgi:hypothetical protein
MCGGFGRDVMPGPEGCDAGLREDGMVGEIAVAAG